MQEALETYAKTIWDATVDFITSQPDDVDVERVADESDTSADRLRAIMRGEGLARFDELHDYIKETWSRYVNAASEIDEVVVSFGKANAANAEIMLMIKAHGEEAAMKTVKTAAARARAQRDAMQRVADLMMGGS